MLVNVLQDSTLLKTIYVVLVVHLVLNAVEQKLLAQPVLQDLYYKTLYVFLLALLVIINLCQHVSFVIQFAFNAMVEVLILAQLVLMVISCNITLET